MVNKLSRHLNSELYPSICKNIAQDKDDISQSWEQKRNAAKLRTEAKLSISKLTIENTYMKFFPYTLYQNSFLLRLRFYNTIPKELYRTINKSLSNLKLKNYFLSIKAKAETINRIQRWEKIIATYMTKIYSH